MKLTFYKYQGAGNDFVMIDNRLECFDKSNLNIVKALCDRRFGIGADGLILIENHPKLDFNMIYYNSDGSQSFCGNGSRCAISFAKFLGIIDKNCQFNSTDGVHDGVFVSEQEIHLNMHDVIEFEKGKNYFFINTGSPHYIIQSNNVDLIDVITEAHKIRYNERFKTEGTNVNFVEIISENKLKIRTYERGVENETLACGTGVTAAALAHCYNAKGKHSVDVLAKGGRLKVLFENTDKGSEKIWLIGAGEQVFKGEINV